MAKKEEKKVPEPKAEAPAAAPPAGQQAQVQVDDADAVCSYANFCRVTGSPEELIIDFGLNSQPMGVPTEPIGIKQRIIVNFFTAKRLLAALHMSVQRHEQAFRCVGNRRSEALAAIGKGGRNELVPTAAARADSSYRFQ